jgi:hypothetical protein
MSAAVAGACPSCGLPPDSCVCTPADRTRGSRSAPGAAATAGTAAAGAAAAAGAPARSRRGGERTNAAHPRRGREVVWTADSSSSSDDSNEEPKLKDIRKESPFDRLLQKDPVFKFAYYSAKKIPRSRPSLKKKAYISDPYLWMCYAYHVPLTTGDVVSHGVERPAAQTLRESLKQIYPRSSADVRDQIVRLFITIVSYLDVQHRLSQCAAAHEGMEQDEILSVLEVFADQGEALMRLASKK